MSDWVAIGSYLTVAVSVVIIVYLVIKARALIYKDDDK